MCAIYFPLQIHNVLKLKAIQICVHGLKKTYLIVIHPPLIVDKVVRPGIADRTGLVTRGRTFVNNY